VLFLYESSASCLAYESSASCFSFLDSDSQLFKLCDSNFPCKGRQRRAVCHSEEGCKRAPSEEVMDPRSPRHETRNRSKILSYLARWSMARLVYRWGRRGKARGVLQVQEHGERRQHATHQSAWALSTRAREYDLSIRPSHTLQHTLLLQLSRSPFWIWECLLIVNLSKRRKTFTNTKDISLRAPNIKVPCL